MIATYVILYVAGMTGGLALASYMQRKWRILFHQLVLSALALSVAIGRIV